MTTPSLVERVRNRLGGLLRRPQDPDRERGWAERESEIEHERHDSVDTPVPGIRGSQPYDSGASRRH